MATNILEYETIVQKQALRRDAIKGQLFEDVSQSHYLGGAENQGRGKFRAPNF